MAAETPSPRTYGNWRKPTSPGLMGLGSLGTMLLLGGLIFMVFVIMAAGMSAGIVVGLSLGAMLLVLLIKDRHDRNLLSRMVDRLGWWNARSAGSLSLPSSRSRGQRRARPSVVTLSRS